jgi:carbonic anhydrase/acetyltransferase-like protein (isoleucine patch superfamily)
MDKYKLTENVQEFEGVNLYRIQALKDFSNVKEGDLGGLIQNVDNLSQEGNCWVYATYSVYGDVPARVYGNAHVNGNAQILDYAQVYGKALISGDALIYGSVQVFGNALVSGSARVFEEAKVYDDAQVYGDAWISDHAEVFGHAMVFGNSYVSGNNKVSNASHVYVHIDFDCDFDPWVACLRLLKSKNAPLLIGLDPDIDKILEQYMKAKDEKI